MEIQKLSWAGVKLTTAGKTILIDAVEDFSAYEPALGSPKREITVLSESIKADYVLFTHLHFDHFDIALISKCIKENGKVIAFEGLRQEVSKFTEQLDIVFLNLDQTYEEEGIIFKPVFAMDGIGDKQCSWVVEDEHTKIFHGGDTIWHNQFWRLGKENLNIDYAFLPVNGVKVDFRMIGLEYSPILASMNLKQAFSASKLLHAKHLVPIHYGLFEQEPYYIPSNFSESDLSALSEKIDQSYIVINDGESLEPELL